MPNGLIQITYIDDVQGGRGGAARPNQTHVIVVNPFNGVIVANPADQTLFEYGQIERKQVTFEEKLRENLLSRRF